MDLTENKPYAELGYGINNILKFVRVDFIHRVNYLQGGASPFWSEGKCSIQFVVAEYLNFVCVNRIFFTFCIAVIFG